MVKGRSKSKIKLVLDTNVFMMTGSNFTFEPILSMIRDNTHVFVHLTCVKKELKKKALEGVRSAVTGLNRLDQILELRDLEVQWNQQVYADDPILEYFRTSTEDAVFISRDKDLKRKVHGLNNPYIQILDLTRKGRLHPFNPHYKRYNE